MKNIVSKIIEVLPLTRLPLSKQQSFSYLCDKKVPSGSLVSVPFWRRTLNGIVVNSRGHLESYKKFRLKKINAIIEPGLLSSDQLKLAYFISDYYLSPLGTVLNFFVPKRVKSRKLKTSAKKMPKLKTIQLTKEQNLAMSVLTRTKQTTSTLLFGPAGSGKTEVCVKAIEKIKKRKSNCQFLVLLPELSLVHHLFHRFGSVFEPDEIALIHSKIARGEFFDLWKKIKLGKIRLIIGTRLAVFLPFNNLEMIIIEEEQDISFKQRDMNPRYDARKVAEKLAEIHSAKLVRVSAAPGVESYYLASQGKYQFLKLPLLKISGQENKLPTVEIVDMRKEYWNNKSSAFNYHSPISKKLLSEISFALKNNLQTILLVNKRGMSAFSVCQNCQTVLRCHRCGRTLIYQKQGFYACSSCRQKTGVFATCPRCGGLSFRNIGLGAQMVEREVARAFPEAKIKRADLDSIKKILDIEVLHSEFMKGDIDILIGTQTVVKGWDNPRIGLCGIIDADSFLSLPDFRSEEQTFQLITQVIGRCRQSRNSVGKVIIQTFNPDNPVIQAAACQNYLLFYNKEIANRKIFSYPPFGKIIKLTNLASSEKQVEKETFLIYNEISKIAKNYPHIKVTVPQKPLSPKVRGFYRRQIIIRLANAPVDFSSKIIGIIKRLGSRWIIDVDPVSLL